MLDPIAIRIEELRRASWETMPPELVALNTLISMQPASLQPGLRSTFEAVAVPHWFDSSIVSKLLSESDNSAAELIQAIRRFPMVEHFPLRNSVAESIHESTRNALRKHLRESNPERFQRLSALAMEALDNDNSEYMIVERLYHQFGAAPDEAADECEDLFRTWVSYERSDILQVLSSSLRELEMTEMLTVRGRIEALLANGWTRYLRGEISKLGEVSEEIILLSRTVSHSSGIARALCLRGEVHQAKGNLSVAEADFREALVLFEAIRAKDPQNSGKVRDLAVAYGRIAAVLQPQGRVQEALIEASHGTHLFRNLVREYPNHKGWLRGLANSYETLGSLFGYQRDSDKAVDALRAYSEISRDLVKSDPKNKNYQCGLAVAHLKTGSVLMASGQLEQALSVFQEQLETFKFLAQSDPSNLHYEFNLGTGYAKIGDAFAALGYTLLALDAYKNFIEIFTRIVEFDNNNINAKIELAVAYSRISGLRQSINPKDNISSYMVKSVQILRSAASASERHHQIQRDLAIVLLNFAKYDLSRGKKRRAREMAKEARAILRRLTEEHPDHVGWRRDFDDNRLCLEEIIA